ncbi:MAG TPA: four helix bundle protein [Salinivirgaceae bacterium]|nr:four helix bundle protein [Salinivirgaceae bacterium]
MANNRNMVLSFRDMDVWNNAMDLVDKVYSLTKLFPKDELFSLTSQIRRSAISVPSNIAEGFNRKNTKEYVQFCYISLGSLAELETQIEIAYRQKYIQATDDVFKLITITKKQLFALINKLEIKTK